MSSCRSVYLLMFDCVLEAALEELFKMSLRVYIERWSRREAGGAGKSKGSL